MNHEEQTRRAFLKTTSGLVAGAAMVGRAGAKTTTRPAERKILNFNPRMGYRRLGQTGLMISEISLGGHGTPNLEDQGARVENRKRVLAKAAELGMNYLDTNIDSECDLYGQALGRDRAKWHIGFASWPQKLTPEYEKELSQDGMMKRIEDRLKGYRTDMLDIWRPVGATWGEGQTAIPTMFELSPRVLDMVVEVFEKARKQGKVRWLGISAHNPKVFRRVLNDYPQFSLIIFPYLFLTEPMGGDSLLALAEQKKVGVIGLKPFGAGTTFGIRPREIHGDVDPRAVILLRKMLQEKRVSAVIPGVNTPEQLEINVKASYERDKPLDEADRQAVRDCTDNYFAHLTDEYQWLHHWAKA
jgi:aryl-alcohol dehydrogenase-like predicted oxidoreductase